MQEILEPQDKINIHRLPQLTLLKNVDFNTQINPQETISYNIKEISAKETLGAKILLAGLRR